MRAGKLPGTDDALKRAQEAIRNSQRPDREASIREDVRAEMKETEPSFVKSIKDTIATGRRLSKAFDIAAKAVETIKDYSGPVGWVAGKVFRGMYNTFKYAAFERENGDFKRDNDGDLVFSGKRLMRNFAMAAGITAATIVGGQYAYYTNTKFTEMVFVTGKQEIVDGELYHVTGCTSLPCSTALDNGKYYQIEKSLYFPRQIYPEENVYANVLQGTSACRVEGYGIYLKELKALHRYFNFYQKLESTSCVPLTEQQIQEAVGQGKILTPDMFSVPQVQIQQPITVQPS